MANETYSLPSELSQEAKLFRFLTIRTFITVVIFIFIGMRCSNMVYETLQTPFMIFNGVVGFYISIVSKTNKQKRYYQSLLIFLFRNRRYYKPIPPQKPLPDTIKKYENYEKKVNFVEYEE